VVFCDVMLMIIYKKKCQDNYCIAKVRDHLFR
jgi:hypothetical protein